MKNLLSMRQGALTDKQIINGLQHFDEQITKDYFYGFCRKAYAVFDAKYQLRYKAGLDFYSLAHDYYIQLLTHNFVQLTDKPAGLSLSSYMTGGFRFVVLDALKAYNAEFDALSSSTAPCSHYRKNKSLFLAVIYRESMLVEQPY